MIAALSLLSLPLSFTACTQTAGEDKTGTSGIDDSDADTDTDTDADADTDADTDADADADADLSVFTQDTDGDAADSARDMVWLDGTLYVAGQGIHERGGYNGDMAWSAYLRAYDAGGAVSAEQLYSGTLDAGEKTWLMNTVLAEDSGETRLYASGRSNVTAYDLCDLDATVPGTDFDGYVFQYALPTLEMTDCFAMATGGFDEIAAMGAGDSAIWLGGSTQGSMGGPSAGESDIWVAAARADMDTPPRIAQIGTPVFDEVLGLDYDAEDDMLYVSGSTRGDLCGLYAASTMDLDCTAGEDNEFDGYVAGWWWDTANSEMILRFVYQFGVPDEDTAQDVAAFHAGDGGRYIYVTGRNPADSGAGDQDVFLSRIRLQPHPQGGYVPATVDGAGTVDLVRVELGGGGGDVGQNLLVTEDHVWVVATTDGATDHAGACGGTLEPDDGADDGAYSHAVGVLWGFSHDDPTAPALTYTRPGDSDLGHRSVNLNAITSGDGYLWAGGITSARFVAGAEAVCGDDPDNEADDEVDAVIVRVAAP